MDNLFKYLVIFFLATSIFSCQNRPSEVMPRKKMERVMYDMYITEAIIDNDYQKFSQSENKEALINQTLRKHKISEARWDTSLSWYSDNIELYLQINDSVKSRLQRNQKQVDSLISLRDSGKDDEIRSADYIPPHFRIAGIGCNRGFKFKLDSTQLAENFADNDTIYFRFKTLGVFPLDTYSLKAMLRIEYSDTIVYEGSKLEENKAYHFNVAKQIEQDTIQALDGFINLSGKFPPVPIQLYDISLGNDAVKDSTQLANDSTQLINGDSTTTVVKDSIKLINESDIKVTKKDTITLHKDSARPIKDTIQLVDKKDKLLVQPEKDRD